MSSLRTSISTNPLLAFAAAVLFGVALSLLHDFTQKMLLPLGEWARVTFIVQANHPVVAESAVNFVFQFVAFGAASFPILWAMRALLEFRTMRHPVVAFLTHIVLTFWWLPFGFVIGFPVAMRPAFPLLPVFVVATALVFFVLARGLAKHAELKKVN